MVHGWGNCRQSELLLKAWEILEEGGKKMGLVLNREKCEWSWLDRSCTQECPIKGVPITPTDKIEMLGVPLGSASFTAEYVQEGLIGNAVKVMDKLLEFEDTQAYSCCGYRLVSCVPLIL